MKLAPDAPEIRELQMAAIKLVVANQGGIILACTVPTNQPGLFTATGQPIKPPDDLITCVVKLDPQDTGWFSEALTRMVQKYDAARAHAAAAADIQARKAKADEN